MRRFPVFAKALRDQRLQFAAWATALAMLAFLEVIMFPQYRDAGSELNQYAYFQGLAGAAGGLDTPAGYLAAEFFTGAPLLVLFYAVILGTGAIAGDESGSVLELVLAQPVRRRRLVLEKAAAMAILVVAVTVAAIPGLLAGKLLVAFDLNIARMAAATLTMAPLALLFLCLGILGSAAIPSRTAATIAVTGAAVAGFFLSVFGSFVSALEQARKISPFYWTDYGSVLVRGVDWSNVAGLLASGALLLAAALVTFDHRDVSSGPRSLGLRSHLRWNPRARPTPATGGARWPVFAKTLRDQRTTFIALGFTVALLAIMTVSIYPTFYDAFRAFDETGAFKELAGEAGSVSSPAGYLSLEFFSYVPIIVLIAVIVAGIGVIAGEESAGTIDLLLAQPVERRLVLIQKFAALLAWLLCVVLVGLLAILCAKWATGFDISNLRLAAAMMTVVPIGAFFLILAVSVSAAFPNRAVGAIAVVGYAVAGYFLNTLGLYIEGMQTVRKLSPFYWSDFSRALVRGFDWPPAAGFAVISLALLGMALLVLSRRDISSTGRSWRDLVRR